MMYATSQDGILVFEAGVSPSAPRGDGAPLGDLPDCRGCTHVCICVGLRVCSAADLGIWISD